MTDTQVIEIGIRAMSTAGKILGPLLLVALVIGVIIGLLQAVTQVQEVTLTFVPKVAGMAVVVLIAGNWMLQQLVDFTRELINSIPSLIGG